MVLEAEEKLMKKIWTNEPGYALYKRVSVAVQLGTVPIDYRKNKQPLLLSALLGFRSCNGNSMVQFYNSALPGSRLPTSTHN